MSPFFLLYNDEGQKIFDRFVAAFLEIPVEFVQESNRPIDYEQSLRTVVIQMPEIEALTYWQNIAAYLREVKSSTISESSEKAFDKLDESHLQVPSDQWPSGVS